MNIDNRVANVGTGQNVEEIKLKGQKSVCPLRVGNYPGFSAEEDKILVFETPVVIIGDPVLQSSIF